MDKEELKKSMAAAAESEQAELEERSKRRAAARQKRGEDGGDAPALDEVSVHLPIPQQTELVFQALAKSPGVGLVLYGGRPLFL